MFDFLLGKVEKKHKVKKWSTIREDHVEGGGLQGPLSVPVVEAKRGMQIEDQKSVGIGINSSTRPPAPQTNNNSNTIDPQFYVPESSSLVEDKQISVEYHSKGSVVAGAPVAGASSQSDDLTDYLRALTDDTPPHTSMPVTRSISEDQIKPSDSLPSELFVDLPRPQSQLAHGHNYTVRSTQNSTVYTVHPFEPSVYEDLTEIDVDKPVTPQIVLEHISKEVVELHIQQRRILYIAVVGKYNNDTYTNALTVDKILAGFPCGTHISGQSSTSLWPKLQQVAASQFTACHLGHIDLLRSVQTSFQTFPDAIINVLQRQEALDVPVHLTASAFQRISARLLQLTLAVPNVEGRTCLHLAAETNRATVMVLLLQLQDKRLSRGIINQKYLKKNYCPSNATQSLNVLQLGGPLYADPQGVLPIHLAALRGSNEAVEVLQKECVDPNSVDRALYTPLQLASKAGNYRTAQILLVAKANVNAKNIHGDSALHMAVERYHEDVVRLLCQHDSCISLPGSKGHTPVQLAAIQGDLQTLLLLLDKKASLGDVVRVVPFLNEQEQGKHRVEMVAAQLESRQ